MHVLKNFIIIIIIQLILDSKSVTDEPQCTGVHSVSEEIEVSMPQKVR